MNGEISDYAKFMRVRNLLKEIQQLSWNITQLEKKYPLEEAEKIGYENMIEIYFDYNKKIQEIAEEFESEIGK